MGLGWCLSSGEPLFEQPPNLKRRFKERLRADEARLYLSLQAQLWLAHASPQTEQFVGDVVVNAAVAAMVTGRRVMVTEMKGRVGRTEPGPVECWGQSWRRDRGARRAVMDAWERLQGFFQLTFRKRDWTAVGR